MEIVSCPSVPPLLKVLIESSVGLGGFGSFVLCSGFGSVFSVNGFVEFSSAGDTGGVVSLPIVKVNVVSSANLAV